MRQPWPAVPAASPVKATPDGRVSPAGVMAQGVCGVVTKAERL